ncbi:UDP-N-acetylglucosamine 1-carboxyvinyltransferase [Weissella viridescens]|uniref:UDP-N-acetylglucosamine 1-carboxyvinyltransferase n=2 Tax=Weissella viridescens TaxID=1629 RepID=A0A0R2H2S6_WEIVI|nr:UDP-N-acetylglucosamine 1-carboxyvinyltransferase [Weissella viridescens]KRN45942.1 UDP-N-acetylglucosamine 1-carboxyvinyltransferase [Weissella viridescens]MBX4173287.1 UDP-N-acetylglucosamine 1-carboxyvinyltransferase [Weissella viridescens]QOD85935.1 UDP-N-acetylglucosamine 1-carboxyvinyltransferase [Weissella viridescens]SOB43615.1 UDP-N-acetylglucosamine 1-carboxyvinyltransferase [Weissella viridescens]GEA95077.1 UDP-N-acetylglucosamine 1-carboxyvinyltransferase 2 [Weissella viridescen
MKKLVIHGGRPLSGEVTIGGAKNSTVALIPAAILSEDPVHFDGMPDILDVYNLQLILESMNVSSTFEDGKLMIDPTQIVEADLPSTAIKSLRASYYFMGSLLGRFGRATVTFPGGDNIGPRPIDQHIKGFEALGATVSEENDTIHIVAENGLKGAHIFLDMVSVGATMNIILAAVHAQGVTTLENAAKEPEIIDLATFLNNMGANIRGAGTDTIRITGVEHLGSETTHTAIPDRIEAGTYLALAAAQGEGVLIKNVIPEHLEAFIAKMLEMGVELDVREDSIYVPKTGKLSPVNIKTAPYPSFATDLQQPITPLLGMIDGTSMIYETIYPERTRHVPELNKLGMNIDADTYGEIAVHKSGELHGTTVAAEEIRAGAALMIAGLMADGVTEVTNAEHVLRGYDRLVHKLTMLNADIQIEDDF